MKELNKEISNEVLKDIQRMLIAWQGYIEDTTSIESWEDEEFKNMAEKYGFNKNNLYKGFEYLNC